MATDKFKLSRRGVIAAIALPVAVPASALTTEPDRELLALNDELERRWKTNWDLYDPTYAAIEAAEDEIQRRAGHIGPGMTLSDAEWQEWWKISCEVRAERGIDAMNCAKRAALEALEEIEQRIFAIPPITLAGFAVWARAIATTRNELWSDERSVDDGDRADLLLARLIEAIVRAGGLAMPVDLVEVMAAEPEAQPKRRRVTVRIVARVDELPTALRCNPERPR